MEGVGGIVAAETFLVDVGLKDIGRMVKVVLEKREAVEELPAALVDEQGGLDADGGVAEALLDFGPTLDAVEVGRFEAKAWRRSAQSYLLDQFFTVPRLSPSLSATAGRERIGPSWK
ncbi:MAG: hypothetical protein WCS42_02030 [Verrucomicrobiota bacterium]